MSPSLYLIAYDICDAKRLGRVARYLVRHTVRLQYSVYIGLFDPHTLRLTLLHLERLIDPAADDVRIYPIKGNEAISLIGVSPMGDGIQLLEDGEDLLTLTLAAEQNTDPVIASTGPYRRRSAHAARRQMELDWLPEEAACQ